MTKCLIIDDVEVTRFSTRQILEPLGIDCICAENSNEALELAITHKPNIIFLDWHIGKESGIELLGELRAKLGKNTTIIMSTGVEDESKSQEALRAGADQFITKPTTSEKVNNVLKQFGIKL